MGDEARQSQLEESTYASQFLLEVRQKRRRIDLHSIKLKLFAVKLELDNSDICLNRRRPILRYNHLESKRRRMTCNPKSYSPSKILKRKSYQYKSVDGHKYKFLLWAREKDDNDNEENVNKGLRFKVTINFMYGLRSGLYIRQEFEPWDIPIDFDSTCNTSNIPVGLAVLTIALGIPDTCRESMFKDISRFAAPYSTISNVILCMEIHIATLQLEGEDVLLTKFYAEVDMLCRTAYLDRVLKNEGSLQPLELFDASSYSCNTNMVKEGEGEEEEEDCCSICLEKLSAQGGCYSYLPCTHAYHYDCIFKWMTLHNFCPLCCHHYRRIFHRTQSKLDS